MSWGRQECGVRAASFPRSSGPRPLDALPGAQSCPARWGPEPEPPPPRTLLDAAHRPPASRPDPLIKPVSFVFPARSLGASLPAPPPPTTGAPTAPPLPAPPRAAPSVGSEEHSSSREGRVAAIRKERLGLGRERLASATSWSQRRRPANEEGQRRRGNGERAIWRRPHSFNISLLGTC